MAVKIDQKIKGYAVVKPEDKAALAVASVPRATIEAELPLPVADVIQMHERIERPEVLIGMEQTSRQSTVVKQQSNNRSNKHQLQA